MFSIFSRKNKNPKIPSIFIHIPKCGGSSFVGVLRETFKEKELEKTPSHKIEKVGNVLIKHIDFTSASRKFKSPSIFNKENVENYKNHLIFLIVRNPIERLISEFNFQYHILDGKNGNKQASIITNLKKQPKNFEEYINFKETQNYQLKFLLGRPLNDSKKVSQKDYEKIIERIDNLPIYSGVTDEYASFLNLFEDKTSIQLTKKVLVRKRTPFLYHSEVSEQLREKIKVLNKFDFMLYEKIKENLKINNNKFKFIEKDQFII